MAQNHITRETEIVSNFPGWLMVQLRNKYNLQYFVETGTCFGYTAQMAAMCFGRVWTIECCEWNFSKQVRDRLDRYGNVTCVLADSREYLPLLMPKLNAPTLFSLDAHWSGEEKYKPPVECSLLDEMRLIQIQDMHVVVIDDWGLIGTNHYNEKPFDPTRWPSKQEVLLEADKMGGTAREMNDFSSPLLVITPRD